MYICYTFKQSCKVNVEIKKNNQRCYKTDWMKENFVNKCNMSQHGN